MVCYMGDKVNTIISIDRELKERARKIGLNITKVCENALRVAVHQMEPLEEILKEILGESKSVEVKQ